MTERILLSKIKQNGVRDMDTLGWLIKLLTLWLVGFINIYQKVLAGFLYYPKALVLAAILA